MADDDVRCDAAGAQRRIHRQTGGDERRLLHLRLDEIFDRAVEAQLLEIHPGGLVALVVDRHRLRHRKRDVAAHAGLERALAGEHECDLAHAAAPVV